MTAPETWGGIVRDFHPPARCASVKPSVAVRVSQEG